VNWGGALTVPGSGGRQFADAERNGAARRRPVGRRAAASWRLASGPTVPDPGSSIAAAAATTTRELLPGYCSGDERTSERLTAAASRCEIGRRRSRRRYSSGSSSDGGGVRTRRLAHRDPPNQHHTQTRPLNRFVSTWGPFVAPRSEACKE